MSPHFVPDISLQMMATGSESDDLSGISSSSIYLPSILPNAPTIEDYPTLNTIVPYGPPINHSINNPILPNAPTTGDYSTLNTMVPYVLPINHPILPNAPTTEDYPTLNPMVPHVLPINQDFNSLQQQVYDTSGSLADQGLQTLR